jgi:cyanophycin synthetase
VLLFAAEELGVPVEVLDYDESLMAFGRGRRRVLVHKEILPLNDRAADWTFEHKWLAHLVLSRSRLPVARSLLATDMPSVEAAARKLGFPKRPVVVKPDRGSQGSGVSADVRTLDELRGAYGHARRYLVSKARPQRYVVQQHAPGTDHRCFVLDGRCIAVARRYHPRIVGDGVLSVRALMDDHNQRAVHQADGLLGPFVVDGECRRMLARAGMTMRSVPAAGCEVRVRSNANGSMGAWSEDATDEASPFIKQLVEKTARAAGLSIAGVDILSENIAGRSARNARPVIVEVNSPPTILPHHYPVSGQPRQVAYDVVRALGRVAARR